MGAPTAVGALGAPGGPLFVPGFVSGCLNVEELQHSWHTLLAALDVETQCGAAGDDADFDVSVEDLKVVTDAELVNKALAEVLRGATNTVPTPPPPLPPPPNSSGLSLENGDGVAESFTAMLLEDNPTTAPEDELAMVVFNPPSAHQQEDRDEAETLLALSVVAEEPEGAPVEKTNLRRRKKKGGETSERKKGRPYDRSRGTGLSSTVDLEAVRREEALIRMQQWRESERGKANLHALRFKQEREAVDEDSKTPLRRWKFFTSTLHFPTKASSDSSQMETLRRDEIVLAVEFYHNQRKHDKMQEFLVLGSQPLTALRDRLYCLTDEIAKKSDLDTKSSYFLIEDVFYNDMRDPDAKDYSQPILQWARESRETTERWNRDLGNNPRAVIPAIHSETENLPNFTAKCMEDTRFSDFQLRIGAQYLYCHQGDCKHIIVIRDIRLAHSKDVQDMAAYPVLKWHARVRHRKCTICNIYQARKVTYEDKLAPACPTFFCEQCYYLLHYDKSGCLLYNDFKVFDYYHE